MGAASPQKVLRIAVVVDDLVCDELHQTEPGAVSVGTGLANELVLYGVGIPARHRLFDFRGGKYFLDLPEHAKGRIALGKKTYTLAQLRKRFGAKGALRLAVSASTKGKLVLGECTILFQFDAPRVPPPRLAFPIEFKPRLDQLVSREEAASLASAALVLGSWFTWAANKHVDPSFSVDDIDERFVSVMGLKPKPKEEVEEQKEEVLAQEEEKEEVEVKEKPEPEKKLTEKPAEFSEKALAQARGVGVARVLGTYGGEGPGTVFDVIQSTENNLGELFAQGMTTTVLADGGDISPFVAGGSGITAHGAMAENKGLETGEGPDLENRDAKRELKIRSDVKASSAEVFGDVDKKAVQATIRQRISALQHCYEKALRTEPSIQGKMTYTISISVMGSVTRVDVEEDTVGSAAVKACTTGKIKGWRFPMQGAEEPADVTFSVVFSGGS
jgi:hypothetical protein